MQARGPACDRYLDQLEQECEQVWKNGRQLCEEISLTGNHCVNEVSGLTLNAVSTLCHRKKGGVEFF